MAKAGRERTNRFSLGPICFLLRGSAASSLPAVSPHPAHPSPYGHDSEGSQPPSRTGLLLRGWQGGPPSLLDHAAELICSRKYSWWILEPGGGPSWIGITAWLQNPSGVSKIHQGYPKSICSQFVSDKLGWDSDSSLEQRCPGAAFGWVCVEGVAGCRVIGGKLSPVFALSPKFVFPCFSLFWSV